MYDAGTKAVHAVGDLLLLGRHPTKRAQGQKGEGRPGAENGINPRPRPERRKPPRLRSPGRDVPEKICTKLPRPRARQREGIDQTQLMPAAQARTKAASARAKVASSKVISVSKPGSPARPTTSKSAPGEEAGSCARRVEIRRPRGPRVEEFQGARLANPAAIRGQRCPRRRTSSVRPDYREPLIAGGASGFGAISSASPTPWKLGRRLGGILPCRRATAGLRVEPITRAWSGAENLELFPTHAPVGAVA